VRPLVLAQASSQGFALLGTYLFFAIFVNAFLSNVGLGATVGYGMPAVLCLMVCGNLNTRDTTSVSRALLFMEGIGITAMVVLVVAILAHGGAKSTGLDFGTFTPSGAGLGSVLAAVVLAFLSWAGFEACAALGEETDNPRRNIPRALFGTVLLTGALFIVVMFAETIGFGTDKKGLAAFAGSSNTLGDLGETYVGHWFSLLILVTAILSAFASNLSSVLTCSRLAMALARDGFGPRKFTQIDPKHRTLSNAIIAAIIVSVIVCVVSWRTGGPHMGTGDPAGDAYFFDAIVGTT
jgi:amino acid transporter